MQKWLEALKEKLTGNKKAALLLGVVALLLVLSAVVLKMGNGNPLYGNWILDEVTGYEFDRNGNYSLILNWKALPTGHILIRSTMMC